MKNNPKYIFVVGGVMSGVGKGVTTASVGAILKSKGLKVTALKADPYVNVDAGTMNPVEHGEVFVTRDADETDQDMGNYERFLNIDLSSENYMTTGRVYMSVIEKERTMKYKGRCVQVVPHIPEEIIGRIKKAQKNHDADITITEIGGTVGEYENILFLEAIREMKLKNPDDVCVMLVSYMPIPGHLGEMKTKPTQHAVRLLNQAGINPDFIIARGRDGLDKPRREKLATFCGVKKENCISAPDVDSIYKVPLNFEEQGLGNRVLKSLNMSSRKSDMSFWEDFYKKSVAEKKEVKIAVVGKYFGTGDYTLSDSYISVIEALKHGGIANNVKVKLEWVDSEKYEKNPKSIDELKSFHAILVPGGFGTRGIDGILKTIQYARENKIPYFGICYGMQLASVEFARNVLGLDGAHTLEIDPEAKEPIIHINEMQAKNVSGDRYGGTMRLGSYDCDIEPKSLVFKAYGEAKISERHRHRYEFNNEYRNVLHEAGMKIVGLNKESDLVEIIELEKHPFFVGVQFHPEFQSRPMDPHPLFVAFVKEGKKQL